MTPNNRARLFIAVVAGLGCAVALAGGRAGMATAAALAVILAALR
jgi:hypothetical protein